MTLLSSMLTLGLTGNPKGWLAGLLVLVWVGVLFGLPYMLLASVYGAKQGYLVIGTATTIILILLSSIWLFGAPGTVAGTGPRGREAAWIPFTPTSQQAQDFAAVKTFPQGWDQPGKTYSGNISSTGELKNLEDVWGTALSARAASQGTSGTDPNDWTYQVAGQPAVPGEETLPTATQYFTVSGSHLISGIVIPATAKHPQVTVFAYHDKGQVFYWAAIILGTSIMLFIMHVAGLAYLERKRKLPVSSPAPANA
jgi:hypothetical protein